MANLKMAHKNFVDSLKAEGKSESTLVAYNKDIEQIIEFIAKQGVTEVDGMDIKHLEGFMKDLNSKGYTPKSISRKTNAARTFIKYLHNEDLLKEDISAQLKHPKLEIKAPRILSRLEYRALRDAARGDLRSYAMIETLLQTGITISELAGMKIKHMDIKGDIGSLFVPTKNNKDERTVPLNKAVVSAIKEYMEKDRPKIEGSDSLFITKTGRAVLVRNIRSTINRYFKLAGVENAKVNDLRHTFVAHHLRTGVSILHLAKIAGHKRVSTTERYLEYIEKPEKLEKTELDVL